MYRKIIVFAGLLLVHLLPGIAQELRVSKNGRFIERSNGTQFLWLGDTAWELFHKLNREEATDYLTKRAQQGFTVIQAVVLAENDGLRVPNAYGDLPLIDLDPAKPNEKYFQHVDFIVNKAEELGLVIGMLPTWGDKVFNLNPGAGPIVFNRENAAKFGEFLGKRYSRSIVWILGGDRNVDNTDVLGIWRAMAAGIKKGDQGKHLMSYHPRGPHMSSYWLHNEEWLDFNIYQSGHEKKYNNVYWFARKNYLLQPVKPFIDGEPAYEDIPVRFWEYCDWSNPLRVPESVLDVNKLIKDHSHFKEGFFNDHDVRVHAYWNQLSGACGYTYGNNAVWQMFKKGGDIAIPCLTDWREALDRPGANSIRHIRTLFEARPLSLYVPDQSAVYGINSEDENYIPAAVAADRSSVMVYLAKGQPVWIVTKKIKDKNLVYRWYNPRNGELSKGAEMVNAGLAQFTPPSSGDGNDWVLLIDGKLTKLKLP